MSTSRRSADATAGSEEQSEKPGSDKRVPSRAPTNVEKLRGLPWGVAWSVSNSVFAQYTFFGSVFILFLNELGLDKVQIGSLLSLLPFLNIIAIFTASTIARLGYKRVFLVSFAARTVMAALLLLTPLILAQFGAGAVMAFVVAVVAIFGIFRSTGLTAFYPWLQEQVPDYLRGKYSAIKNTLASLASFLAVMVAGYVLGADPALSRFMILIAVGVLFGALSIWAATRMPGGAPQREAKAASSLRQMVSAARDRNFVHYLIGFGLVTLSVGPLSSFVPLFMSEQVGLSANQVVWLSTATLLGGVASSYLWGWLADRYGSKPVMVSGVNLLPLLPLAWLLMPRQSPWNLYIALTIAVAQGFITTGWNIGSARLLFVRVVPPAQSPAYMALYYAWAGIAGGLGQLLGGWLVDASTGLEGQWGFVHYDAYTLLFLLGTLLPLISYWIFKRVRADSPVTGRQFAGLFLRGNPLLALQSLVRYHRARDERAAVTTTERLGSTRSPLTVEELIEALHDPRFFVRFEAVVSMARHGSDPRLTDALIETLEGEEPALSTIAAWGLGRLGDRRALPALRRGLEAPYRSVQAHCARSLGSLGDRTVLPLLMERLTAADDIGLRMAFASALGRLQASEAVRPLLDLLCTSGSHDARSEFALALARILDQEREFVQMQRKTRSDPGTVLSQKVADLRGKLLKADRCPPEMEAALDVTAETFAQGNLEEGVRQLHEALHLLPADYPGGVGGPVVSECLKRMEQYGPQRLEYVLLVLLALESAGERD